MPDVVKFPRDMISTLSLGSLGETSTSPCIDLHRDVARTVDAPQSHIEPIVQEPDFGEGVAACAEEQPRDGRTDNLSGIVKSERKPLMSYALILIDNPRPMVRRITLNRPDKRNALNNQLRTEVLKAVEEADRDPEIRVSILRGAGTCFSAGYDLAMNNTKEQPYYTAGGAGNWPRHVIEGSFRIWDMAKPVIAQVHGYCLAGASELATACDLVYVAEDAQIGYPPVRLISPPDMHFHPWLMGMRAAMEAMLTGDAISGIEAARTGFANRAFPPAELEERVLEMAERVAKIPSDLQQMNKRSVHRAMEIMGARAAIRAGTELQALGMTTHASREYMKQFSQGVTHALSVRDKAFGDYREREKKK